MMKLSTMLKVDNTMDTQERSRIADHILEQWEYDQGSARWHRSSTNFVYSFRKGGAPYFLRFAESTERTGEAIEAEMALLNFLDNQGMRVSTPVASKNDRRVATVETDLGTFHAVVFAQLPGREVEFEELSPAQFERWGAALGKLHTQTHLYQDPKVSARGSWRDHLALIRNAVQKDEPRVQAECDYLASFLAALPVTATNFGLIHGDFELDNLRWQDETIAMFDFDECVASWYIADVAFALRDLFPTSVDLSHPSFRAFIRGYSQQYELDEDLLAHLPTFMRLVNLIIYARLVRATDLAQDQVYPEWCTTLLSALANWKRNYNASLLAIPM